jgi:arabinose-5-phosphate isomerase
MMPDKALQADNRSEGLAPVPAARRLFAAYGDAINRLDKALGAPFAAAVEMILATSGHVVVCGMGKSGLIGRKIAATLASTGTPSLFLHPAEEIVRLLPALQRLDAKIIALTAGEASSMARAAQIVLDISVDREACPLNLAPTTSAMNTLVLGDAIAVALMEARGFEAVDFAMTHPGGALGRRLLTRVRDQMRSEALPFVDADAPVQDAILVMTEGRLGLALVGSADKLQGVLTDGDLRRLLVRGLDLARTPVGEVASSSPLTINADQMMADAEARMQESRVQCLVVTDASDHVVGVVQIFE